MNLEEFTAEMKLTTNTMEQLFETFLRCPKYENKSTHAEGTDLHLNVSWVSIYIYAIWLLFKHTKYHSRLRSID